MRTGVHEVRCATCGRRLFDIHHDVKGMATINHGSLSIKCSKCGREMFVDFANGKVKAIGGLLQS